MKFNFTPFPQISTERLILRQVTSNDCAEILFLRSNKQVNTFIKRAAPSNLKEAELFLEKISKGIKNNEIIYWGITLKKSSKMIGSICLWNFSAKENKAEVGYDLNPKFQNLGIMSEALKAIVDYGFKNLQLNTIEAFTHSKNEKSIKLLKKNGFDLILDKTDKDNLDNIIFSLSSRLSNEN